MPEPVSPLDVKLRLRELPAAPGTTVAFDQQVFVDGDVSGAAKASPAQLTTAAFSTYPQTTDKPSSTTEIVLLDGGLPRRYPAISSFTSENTFFLGAFPSPPATNPNGLALIVGNQYFNTTNRQTYIYTGSGAGQGWQLYGTPYPATQTNYFFHLSVATDTVVGLDDLGQLLSFTPSAGDTVQVFANGSRLSLNVDYLLMGDGSIELGGVLCAGTVVEVIVRKPAQLSYAAVPTLVDTSLWILDGSSTQFALRDALGIQLFPPTASAAIVSKNNIVLNPGRDYSVSGGTITFLSAPQSGTSFWMVVGLPLVPPHLVNVLEVDSGGTQLEIAPGVVLLTSGGQVLSDDPGAPTALPGALIPSAACPPPTLGNHGNLCLLSRTGFSDSLYVCAKEADDVTFVWRPILYALAG